MSLYDILHDFTHICILHTNLISMYMHFNIASYLIPIFFNISLLYVHNSAAVATPSLEGGVYVCRMCPS